LGNSPIEIKKKILMPAPTPNKVVDFLLGKSESLYILVQYGVVSTKHYHNYTGKGV